MDGFELLSEQRERDEQREDFTCLYSKHKSHFFCLCVLEVAHCISYKNPHCWLVQEKKNANCLPDELEGVKYVLFIRSCPLLLEHNNRHQILKFNQTFPKSVMLVLYVL